MPAPGISVFPLAACPHHSLDGADGGGMKDWLPGAPLPIPIEPKFATPSEERFAVDTSGFKPEPKRPLLPTRSTSVALGFKPEPVPAGLPLPTPTLDMPRAGASPPVPPAAHSSRIKVINLAPCSLDVIDAIWVYKWKADETGKIVKAKARLVAKGFKQKHGVDYLEAFSPTAKTASIRLLSELDHEVFMKLPPGCESMSGKAVRLDKSLYGLRQASRTFHKRLVSDLKTIGFEQSLSDPCVLRFIMGDEMMDMIAIHVDDILYGGIESLATTVVQALGDSFRTKNLGEVKFFLGCAFNRDREARTIEMSQVSCVRRVLERFNICRTSPIPASPASDYRSVTEEEKAGDLPFREVAGSLMWIANQTRPDISNAVRVVARHSRKPKKSHWKADQKILNYLMETTLKYKQDTMVDVGTLVYVDADFAKKATDRRSVLGALVLVADCLVAWISRTQKCVTLSTTEAEYVAMGDGVKGALFVRNARVLEIELVRFR
ncbi:unnamed protein product [Ectocarpus sp. CCAP 1310/34]|nr:unnamed protein product [Ectocarpus sp. CCAP 1310/34]